MEIKQNKSSAILFIFTALIKTYQRILSPIFGGQCRFYPTCSEYALMALKKDGLLKGTAKSVWRILRCNPLNEGGIDYP